MDVSTRFCRKCSSEKQYNAEYDAIYCELCNEWLERTCDDPECEYCSTRPAKPSQCISNVG